MRNSESRRRPGAAEAAALAALSGRITRLEPQKRDQGRLSLYVDDRFVLGVSQEVALRLGLRAGEFVESAVLLQALQGDEAKRARDEALRFLGTRPRSREEVRRKLIRRYGPDLAEQTVADLDRAGWLDDAAFAQSWVESHRGAGHRRLQADLLRRGVPRDVIERVLGAAGDRHEEAFAAALSRYRRLQSLEPGVARRRLYAFLLRRGFDREAAAAAVRRAVAGREEDGA
jgi:regulatory protein